MTMFLLIANILLISLLVATFKCVLCYATDCFLVPTLK